MAVVKEMTKRVQIDKANAMMVAVIAGAAFVSTFSLVASRALWTKQSYQNKVIREKVKARDQLKKNLRAADSLVNSYKEFVGSPTNVLGGNPTGQGDRDGDNGKIVLNALPSKYDFPALATSMDKLLSSGAFHMKSFGGTDDEVIQSQSNSTSGVIEIPMTYTVEGSYQDLKAAAMIVERSIRPINAQSVTLTGIDKQMTMAVTAKTFYQPTKTLELGSKVVK